MLFNVLIALYLVGMGALVVVVLVQAYRAQREIRDWQLEMEWRKATRTGLDMPSKEELIAWKQDCNPDRQEALRLRTLINGGTVKPVTEWWPK